MSEVSGFQRLHPHLQHAIVHELGWRELRPVQDLTIDAVLDGANAVVLAPTAGGKTEAALFPVLSRILAEESRPVAALYVCPIRALLNNQEERVSGYARMVGLSAFKWHGDVAESRRQRFRAEPSHVLMTTPESLEVMMISARTDARALLGGVQTVIVDEVHAFAADDRGAHLAALLERIAQFAGRDIQRIGLSATVGNPRVIGEWLRGSSDRDFRLVDPPKAAVERDLAIDYCADVADAASGVARLARGKKSLVFVESRSRAEAVAHALTGSGVEVFIHHSSVSRAEREHAEFQFVHGQNTAIVCTATMELGIDVGDLDQVLQVDAPASVASFLQRMGRTGRREGKRANCSFFCLSPESLLQAAAVVRLAARGWVEDIRPAEHASHVLAHQVMALALQESGISRHRVLEWIREAYPFTSITDDELQVLVDTMVSRQILYEADGVLSLGARGETLYGRKHFFELYAVFSSAPMLRVMHGRDEIGYVQSSFVQGHGEQQGPLSFRLAGRPWEVTHIDWSKATMSVNPAPAGRVPSWIGAPGVLSYQLCQAIREVLASEDPIPATMMPSAEAELRSLRQSYASLLESGDAPVESSGDTTQWHTFGGGAINRLLAAGLESVTRRQWVAGNLSVRSKEASLVEANEALAQLRSLTWEPLAFARARSMARGLISKFQPCLPTEAEDRLLCEKLLDLPGALRFLASTGVISAGVAPAGDHSRLPDQAVDTVPAFLEAPTSPPGPSFEPANPIAWVDRVEGLRAACEALLNEKVIGLDVETALDFATLCLIQLATPTRTWLIDALAIADLSPLAPLMGSSTVTKVIHNARFERRVLAKHGLPIQPVFDTLEASRVRHGPEALGGHTLAAVVERELGVHVDKAEQTSNWARRPLSKSQRRYAASDAEVLLALFGRMSGSVHETTAGDGGRG